VGQTTSTSDLLSDVSSQSSGPHNQIYGIQGAGPYTGTFTLTFSGYTTDPIDSNTTSAIVQAALEGLSSIGSGNVSCNTDYGYIQIVFVGSLAGAAQTLTGDFSEAPQGALYLNEIQHGGF
jgi:trimeric autotransporter adhesin